MLTKSAEWYIEHFDQISQFEKWIEIFRSEVPREIRNLVKSAADVAVAELSNKHDDYSSVSSSKDSDGFSVYWFLANSYDDERRCGACVSAWIPKTPEGLSGDSEYPPVLGLYYEDSKKKMEQVGKQISSALKRIGKIEDGMFTCVQRQLKEINVHALLKPKDLEKELARIFKEFTDAARPGLLLAPKR